MRRLIFLSSLLFAMSSYAGDDVTGGFVVAPLTTGSYVACGTNLASSETETSEGSFISGIQLFVTNASVMTDIENVNGNDGISLFCLKNGELIVTLPSTFYTLDGKLLFRKKANTCITIEQLPDLFIIKMKNGTSYKIMKSK